ncbi:D-alanyl-D-alanine carboxypeptidase/D-alanyl-D-alanine-endopeptidase [Catalinimonas alkaloidigena]|uniref:D-alanyl-D-alanine carboxypeptidase/D-alanyl-D-alanine endopeptidase n=1 Tax=Catalinimonas alkaloidigena TaxID=1075417 RepID=UPI0015A2C7F1|nr:D-alanyl-D-alanine carboxypeptidase/D-alanyl-D-alanine-endopeptidase [Catalinimonas alkaloidigena]
MSLRVQAQSVPALDALRKELDQLEAHPALRHAGWGFVVKRVSDGQTIVSRHAERALPPASTLKLVTTGAALSLLGPNYRYRTFVEWDGNLDQSGTLYGNLYIRGTGDPTLGSDRFEGYPDAEALLRQWAQAVADHGIKRIEGQVIADDRAFDSDMPDGWIWQDVGNYYGAPAFGLNFRENLYHLYFKPGQPGEPASVIRTVPVVPGLQFDNRMLTGAVGSGDQGYIYGVPFTSYRTLRGTIPAGPAEFSIKGSLPDPPLQAAFELTQALEEQGIKVTQAPGSARTQPLPEPKGRQVITTTLSPPLGEIVDQINLRSLNLYAEAVLKTLGYARKGLGSTDTGLKEAEAFWNRKQLDVAHGFQIYDGSGLSPGNGITPEHMAQLCCAMRLDPSFPSFYESLPVAGRSGTLSSLGRGSSIQGNVHAKSGSINRVLCYVGYVTTRSGDLLAFAMMASHFDGSFGEMRDRWEQLMIRMAALP